MIVINGGDGSIHVNTDGTLTADQPQPPPYPHVTRVDIEEYAEYLRYSGLGDMPDAIDILCVGYWYRFPDGREGYEPPTDYRRPIVRRPVWYIGTAEAQSYPSETQGRAVHTRASDAIGVYLVTTDGTHEWLWDEKEGERVSTARGRT